MGLAHSTRYLAILKTERCSEPCYIAKIKRCEIIFMLLNLRFRCLTDF